MPSSPVAIVATVRKYSYSNAGLLDNASAACGLRLDCFELHANLTEASNPPIRLVLNVEVRQRLITDLRCQPVSHRSPVYSII